MKQLQKFPLFCFSLFLFAAFIPTICKAQKRPNIVLIVADDAGYADFGFQGSSIMKTPHLDKLARQGMRFTQAYVSAAVCGPSRAGLLTGKYQQRFGFEENNVPGYMSHNGITDDDMGLPLDQKTVGNYMQERGYRTALIGKWHQGNADRYHPNKRGFDAFYGFRGGARSYFGLVEKQIQARPEDRLERNFEQYLEPEKYLTDVFADETVSFIEKNKGNPFLVILAFNAVHTPMDSEKSDLEAFPNLTGKRKKLAAMTLSLDRACGKVMDKLAELGLEENTLVIFTNDNGGPTDASTALNDPLSGTKATHLEGGIRVPFLMRWPGVIPEQAVYDFPVSTLDLLPTFFAAAGGELPDTAKLDGVDLKPYLTGLRTDRPHETLFWKKESRGAVRDGDWKLIRFPDRPAELYRIDQDVSEVHDLATDFPDKVRELYKKLFAWEMTLERSLWQLKRKYEGADLMHMDQYRKSEQ